MSILGNILDMYPNILHNRNCSACGRKVRMRAKRIRRYTMREQYRLAGQDGRLLGCKYIGVHV